MKRYKSRISYFNAYPNLYIDGEQSYKAISELIDSAKSYIYIETFMFHNDQTGKELAEKLIAKNKEGIDVRIIIDNIGARFGKGDTEIFLYLKENGVKIKQYPPRFISFGQVNISHRKIFLADGRRLITGGMNIGDDYRYHWHDLMVDFRGEIVKEAEKEFLYDWYFVSGIKKPPRSEFSETKLYDSVEMQLLSTSVNKMRKKMTYEKFLKQFIRKAKKRILFANCYFSAEKILRELIKARKRGVNVEVFIPESNDIQIHKAINKSSGEKLIEKNCKVFLYQKMFSHLKLYLIDDLVIIGSGNLDNRSLRYNQELSVAIFSKKFAAEISAKIFDVDRSESRQALKKEHFKLSFIQKILLSFTDVIDYYI